MTKKKYFRDELEELYIKKNLTAQQIADHYNTKLATIKSVLSQHGLRKTEQIKADNRLEKILNRYNVTEEELKVLLKGSQGPKTVKHNIDFPHKRVKYGVLSDTHMGSIYYDPDLMTRAAKEFEKEKVDFVLHCGDVCEGHYEGRRAGSVFELSHIGGDNQVNYAVEEINKINRKIPFYFITGNHENNTFYKLMGFEIGKHLEDKIENVKFLGNAEGIIELPFNQKIMMLHPDGGSSYAISYRSQKIAESLDGGKKPAILHIGHFHKAEYLYYRNIHIFQAGCLQSQSKFMKGRHLSAHKGFYVVDAEVSKAGVKKISPTFYSEY